MEILSDIIRTTLESFDFAYCIAVNVLTYVCIVALTSKGKKKLSTWKKRLVLLAAMLITGVVYYISGTSLKLILNSAILAPVFWSWVFKPICTKFNLDYKDINFKD